MKNEYYKYDGKDNKAKVMADYVAGALRTFCEQEQEFEQAIEQSGKTFTECMDSVAKGVGGSISDLDAVTKAVKFYFPTAEIEFKMVIRTSEFDKEEHKEETKQFSLADLF